MPEESLDKLLSDRIQEAAEQLVEDMIEHEILYGRPAHENGLMSEESANLFAQNVATAEFERLYREHAHEEGLLSEGSTDQFIHYLRNSSLQESSDVDNPEPNSTELAQQYLEDVTDYVQPLVTDAYVFATAPPGEEISPYQRGVGFWEEGFMRLRERNTSHNQHTLEGEHINIVGDSIDIGQEGTQITIAGKDFKKLCDDLGAIIKALDLDKNTTISGEIISEVKQKIKTNQIRKIVITKGK